MLMKQWIRLSPNTIPLIERELKAILSAFSSLREKIDSGEMQAVEDLVIFKQKVGDRLSQIQHFCQSNEQVQGIIFLLPLKNRLQRIVASVSCSSKINEGYNEVPWKVATRNKEKDNGKATARSSGMSVSPLKQSKMSVSNRSIALKQNTNTSNSRLSRESKLRSSKSTLKVRQSTEAQDSLEQIKPIQKDDLPYEASPALEISFNNKQIFSEQKETVFTVTMTKQQYEAMLRLKKKQTKSSLFK